MENLPLDEGPVPFLVGLGFLFVSMVLTGIALGCISKVWIGGTHLANVPLAILGSLAGGLYALANSTGFSLFAVMLAGSAVGAALILLIKRLVFGDGVQR